jgi:ribonuclease D
MSSLEEIVVADPQSLADCCTRLAKAAHLGFDTEFVGEETYEPSLCLIQVATADALFLIDPLSAGPLDAFWRILIEPARTVVVHAGREEVRLCRRFSGQAPNNWFDLQIAAGLVGLNYPMGHGALVYHLLGVELSKGETLTDWRRRPLADSQIHYAFNDVRFLLPLWQRLDGQLAKLNRRDWARQEFARFIEQALPEVSNQPALAEKWRKLKGLGALDRRKLALVREMFQAREAIAAQMNRPPRVLVRDDLLVEVARRNPKSASEVQTMRGMAKRFVQPLWEAIERAR